jgi:hypothetical protein
MPATKNSRALFDSSNDYGLRRLHIGEDKRIAQERIEAAPKEVIVRRRFSNLGTSRGKTGVPHL